MLNKNLWNIQMGLWPYVEKGNNFTFSEYKHILPTTGIGSGPISATWWDALTTQWASSSEHFLEGLASSPCPGWMVPKVGHWWRVVRLMTEGGCEWSKEQGKEYKETIKFHI